jgi:uncharacterized phiE125 gp8 family phage protein
MLAPLLISGPDERPISLEEAKAHARVYHAEDDALIETYIAAAVAHLDGRSGVLGRCMVDQQWRAQFSAWPADRQLRLPFPDVSAVVVTYRDEDDAEQTLSATMYEVAEDEIGGVLQLRRGFNSPALADDRAAPISVTFTAGYGDAEDVPATLRAALLLIVGHFYENREAVIVGQVDAKALPLGVDTLIAPHRRVPV